MFAAFYSYLKQARLWEMIFGLAQPNREPESPQPLRTNAGMHPCLVEAAAA
jgi:hypothetical protein